MTSTLRGKVIKTPDATPGLLFVNGRQYPFQVERIWQSPTAPALNMTVDIEVDENSGVRAIRAVPESQLAEEQAALALRVATAKGTFVTTSSTASIGKQALIAMGVLAVSGYFLDLLSFPTRQGIRHVSCWEFLGWLSYTVAPFRSPLRVLLELGSRNEPTPGAGTSGLLAIASLAGPLLPVGWKDRRAVLGGLLPLGFLVYLGLKLWWFVQASVTPDMLGYLGARNRIAGEERLLSAVGLGGYVATAAALYLAVAAVVKYLARKRAEAG